MRECSHEYDSYNGGLRCHLCDNRISESEYTEWLEAQVEALREAVYNVWDGKQLYGKKDYVVCKDDLDALNALLEQEE